MLIARGILGGILLFLGRELNFLFAGGMAALVGFRLLSSLPAGWPRWSELVFVAGLAIIAAVVTLTRKRFGYFLSGFLTGGYFLVEYTQPGVLILPLLPFIIGGVIGSLIMGIFTEWALIIVSCLAGVYFLMGLFVLSPTAETLVGAGLFIIGAVTQVIIMRMQKAS